VACVSTCLRWKRWGLRHDLPAILLLLQRRCCTFLVNPFVLQLLAHGAGFTAATAAPPASVPLLQALLLLLVLLLRGSYRCSTMQLL